MSNTIGDIVKLTIFGESHGKLIGATLDGMPSGIAISEAFIKKALAKRRPRGKFETARVENDDFEIVSGVYKGFTTGAPLTIIIPNSDVKSSDYDDMTHLARPSHADYSSHVKYHGFEDPRGGGHFSGRISAGIVAIGAICMMALNKLNIKIATHILKCGSVLDQSFTNVEQEIDHLLNNDYPLINDLKDEINKVIEEVKNDNDSIGGIVQTGIVNLPAGLGEPWFDATESQIAKAIFAIGATKGIEFGSGFAFASMRGSDANEQFAILDGKVVTLTNHNGGINGGITNGMPIIFNTAIKPTPSIGKTQKTIDFITNNEATITIKGRHDPAIIRRICPVIDAMTAIVLCDMLVKTYGSDVFKTDVKK